MNLPNQLTCLRIILMPFSFFLILTQSWTLYLTGYVLAFLIGFTDILDGYLARRFNVETKFGKFLDPVADKIFVIAFLLYFLHFQWIPFWFIVLVLMREIIMTDVRAMASMENYEVKVNQWGKYKTLSQNMLLMYLGFLRLLFLMNKNSSFAQGWLHEILWFFIALTAFLTSFSLISYLWQSRTFFKRKSLPQIQS